MATDERTERTDRQGLAAAELQRRCPDLHAYDIIDSLTVGFSHLRQLFEIRARKDVERTYGPDSMMGMSVNKLEKQEHRAKLEIEAYLCYVVHNEAVESGFVDDSDDWFLQWIFRLRFGDGFDAVLSKRRALYDDRTRDERRLKFMSLLQRTMPQSARAPLVLFRLFPRAIRVMTAVAFGDPLRAQELRAAQAGFLPAVNDCEECHGRVLDNEDICRCCGNPIWNFAWLLSD